MTSLPTDFAASVSETLPDRASRGWLSLTGVPAVAATVVVAVAAAVLVCAISPRRSAPLPAARRRRPIMARVQPPDPRAVIECQLPDSCEEVANAASSLLPGGESNWVIIAGRARGQLHAEVHACYPSGDYYLVDVFDLARDQRHRSARRAGQIRRAGRVPLPHQSPTPEPTPSPTAQPTGYFVRWQNDDEATYHVELIEYGPPDDPTAGIYHPGPSVQEIPAWWTSRAYGKANSRSGCSAATQWLSGSSSPATTKWLSRRPGDAEPGAPGRASSRCQRPPPASSRGSHSAGLAERRKRGGRLVGASPGDAVDRDRLPPASTSPRGERRCAADGRQAGWLSWRGLARPRPCWHSGVPTRSGRSAERHPDR